MSPLDRLAAWRRRLSQLAQTHRNPDDQAAIAEEIARVDGWIAWIRLRQVTATGGETPLMLALPDQSES